MSENNNSAATSGGGGFVLLGVAFVVLKLCHVINWSWWWVTAPFWGPVAFLLVIALGALLIWGVLRLLESKESRARRRINEMTERFGSGPWR